MQGGGNAYNLRELAGAFGDLGTLIPFLVGYITISKMDPVGILVSFGLFKIIAGLYFKTPIPIQPMKAIGTAVASEPALLSELGHMAWRLRLPALALTKLGPSDLRTGILVLGLPQVGLTLGNAIIATVEENNTVFPARPTTVKTVAIDHGLMNLVGASLGGVPMCHGAGGMAAHIRFGARTGGALVILGSLILFVGLFFADSVATLFKLFPRALLGVILMFGGLELAAGVHENPVRKEDRYVMLLTAGVSLWNMGVGYVAGLVLWHAYQRGWLKA